MQFEFFLSLAIFLVLSVIVLLWQPTRLILKEIFKNPLSDSAVGVVSDKANKREARKATEKNEFGNKSGHVEV